LVRSGKSIVNYFDRLQGGLSALPCTSTGF
jgi:hypothetical protein